MVKLKAIWKKFRQRRSEVGKENTSSKTQCTSPEERAAIDICTQLLAAHNSHDVDVVKTLSDENCLVCFDVTNDELTLDDYLDTLRAVMKSFPDFVVETDDIAIAKKTESSDDTDETILVRVSGNRVNGTHTGAPFAFGPYPEIPTSGIHVQETGGYTMLIHILNNKIYKIIIKGSEGKSLEAGPALFYTKIGGVLF